MFVAYNLLITIETLFSVKREDKYFWCRYLPNKLIFTIHVFTNFVPLETYFRALYFDINFRWYREIFETEKEKKLFIKSDIGSSALGDFPGDFPIHVILKGHLKVFFNIEIELC